MFDSTFINVSNNRNTRTINNLDAIIQGWWTRSGVNFLQGQEWGMEVAYFKYFIFIFLLNVMEQRSKVIPRKIIYLGKIISNQIILDKQLIWRSYKFSDHHFIIDWKDNFVVNVNRSQDGFLILCRLLVPILV